MSDECCDRCGAERYRFDVTNFGDAKPRYIYAECPCPEPSCTFCEKPLKGSLTCNNVDCFFVGQVVPEPVMR